MAKYHITRLEKKYNYTGGKYQSLMTKIISHNTEQINIAVARKANQELVQEAARKKDGKIKIPMFTDALDSRKVHARKAATKGKILTNTLRDKLAKDLREVLGNPELIMERGRNAGEINRKMLEVLRDKMQQSFLEYTSKGKRNIMPTNIQTIAETELRSAVSATHNAYARKVMENNPDIVMVKTWHHVKSLSTTGYRRAHAEANRMSVPMNQPFPIRNYTRGGVDLMMYPHDPSAPAEQVIRCHCYVTYSYERKY